MGGCCIKEAELVPSSASASASASSSATAPALVPASAPATASAPPAEGQNPGVPQEHAPVSSHSFDTNQETYLSSSLAPGPSNIPSDVTQTAPVVQQILRGDEPSTSHQTANSSSTHEIVAEDNHGNAPLYPDILEEEDTCPICLEVFDARNPADLTRCGHLFHPPCLREWMERSKSCPVCNQDID